MKWRKKGHEFDSMISCFHNKNQKMYIWGAGTFGMSFYDRFKDDICCVGFIDSNKEKQGKEFCGLPVISPEEFYESHTNEIVVVSTGQTSPVYQKLEYFGLNRYCDYFHIDEYSSMYMMNIHDKVFVSDITLDITECCTLKCEYCNAFIPRICSPKNVDFVYIKEDLEQYFKWVDEVNILGICGGDAMVHPQFDEILEWIGENYYPLRAKHLEIYSNAVILPSEKSIELFKKFNVIYRFTDYSGTSGKQNIDDVVRILEKNGILYDHVKFTDWYDCGFPQKTNGITTEEGLIRFCESCDRKSCHTLKAGKLFCCGLCINADRIDYCKITDSDYFDLSNFDKDRRMEFLEYNLGFSEKGYFEYCKMCNGGSNINTHKISVGKQQNR